MTTDVRELLREHGTTYAAEAGITLRDKPAPLFQLLVLSIGPTGADIFCREVQLVWPSLRPYFDKRAVDGAKAVGLPTNPKTLAAKVAPDEVARLAAALVRVDLA